MIDHPAKTTSVQLGQFQLHIVSGGRLKMDGGTMFGVVPKALWSRHVQADAQNRLVQETNCLLIDTGDHKILLDTGYGGKLLDKQRDILAAQPGTPLLDNLQRLEISADEIDIVIFSHLHFDHAGGATSRSADGLLGPTFTNAQHIVQRHEWMLATAGLPELAGAYPQDNLLPLLEAGCLQLIDGPVDIVPGVRCLPTGGHTPGHQAIQITSEGEGAIYLGDLCPTSLHLPSRWGTSYDLNVLDTRRKKTELLGKIVERSWLAFFDHDPLVTCAKLARDDDREFRIRTG